MRRGQMKMAIAAVACVLAAAMPALTAGMSSVYAEGAAARGVPVVLDGNSVSVRATGSAFEVVDESGTRLASGDAFSFTGEGVSIKVEGGVQGVALELADVQLDGEGAASPIDIKSGADVDISLSSENALVTTGDYAGVHVPDGASVSIDGTGSLAITVNEDADGNLATGAGIGGSLGETAGTISIEGGTVTVDAHSEGAGIGGGGGEPRAGSGGHIMISDGTVDVSCGPVGLGGGTGAGIGGGASSYIANNGSAGTIEISGGSVTAHSYVNVEDSEDYFMTRCGAAIGSCGNKGGTITISGGTVSATMTDGQSAAIGVGSDTYGSGGSGVDPAPDDPMEITITGDASVTALTVSPSASWAGEGQYMYAGAAIGSTTQNLQPCTITIDGNATVDAHAGWYAAGIGGGYIQIPGHAQPMTITIGGNSKVKAQSDYYGAGIGSGLVSYSGTPVDGCDAPEITINGNAEVEAYGGSGGAGIGAGMGAHATSVTISDSANVLAYGSYNTASFGEDNPGAAGIGGGCFQKTPNTANSGTVLIEGDTSVEAHGGPYSPGIGAGSVLGEYQIAGLDPLDESAGDAESISIVGNAVVKAYGGTDAPAIGGAADRTDYDGNTAHTSGGSISIAGTADVEAYATGARYAIDLQDSTLSVSASMLNGIFAEGELVEGQQNVVTLFRNGGDVSASTDEGGCQERDLSLPAGYRAFAAMTELSDEAYWVQNASNESQFATWSDGDESHARFEVGQTVLSQNGLRWDEAPVIGISNLSIYSGGDDSDDAEYDDANSDATGFPIPVFDGLDDVDEFAVDGWDGSGGNPFVVRYYDMDTGERIVDDSIPGVYDARIELVDEAQSAVVTADEIPVTQFDDEDIYLAVRYTSDSEAAKSGRLTSAVLHEAPTAQLEPGTIRAVVDEDSVLSLNGNSELSTALAGDRSGLALLADDLLLDRDIVIDGEKVDTETALLEHAQSEGYSTAGKDHEIKYLDLVDTADGNAWVSSSAGATIYWAYPEGTDSSTDFQLLHFADLHRNYFGDQTDGERIEQCAVEEVQIEKTEQGIVFYVSESGFSPFMLTWTGDETSGSDSETPGSGSSVLPGTGDTAPAAAVLLALCGMLSIGAAALLRARSAKHGN